MRHRVWTVVVSLKLVCLCVREEGGAATGFVAACPAAQGMLRRCALFVQLLRVWGKSGRVFVVHHHGR